MGKLVNPADLKSAAQAYRFESDYGYQGKLMKARIEFDSAMQYYIQDAEYLSIIDPDGYYKTIELPDEVIEAYRAVQKENNKMQDLLRKIYNESFRTHYKTATT